MTFDPLKEPVLEKWILDSEYDCCQSESLRIIQVAVVWDAVQHRWCELDRLTHRRITGYISEHGSLYDSFDEAFQAASEDVREHIVALRKHLAKLRKDRTS